MLIRFTVENWRSFLKPATLTMIAGRERQHGERVPRVPKYPVRILPIAGLYGGNASGKTNFFKALNFLRRLVLKGTEPDGPISVEPFRLQTEEGESSPCRFSIEILVDEIIYEFSTAVTRKEILEEKLVKITSKSETTLYHRKGKTPNFDETLKKDEFIHFAFRGTRENQLFLTNAVSQKVETFKPVYDWFRYQLDMIAPDTRFARFEHFIEETAEMYSQMNEMLRRLDTGISSLGGIKAQFENILLPAELKNHLIDKAKDGETFRLHNIATEERFIVKRENGTLKAKKLVSIHEKPDGTKIQFDLRQESDGNQRIIDILPAFIILSNIVGKKVFVFDELDRSLHTLLTRTLLENYLSNCSQSTRSQLLFTTHDALLMDQDLLRRDEIWVTERSADGSSNLFSFSEYKEIRYDKDIRKSYLQGRLGGIPRLLLDGVSQLPGTGANDHGNP